MRREQFKELRAIANGGGIDLVGFRNCDADFETCKRLNLYWRSNADWWYFDRQKDEYFLTEKALKRAKRSFELFMTPLPSPVKKQKK